MNVALDPKLVKEIEFRGGVNTTNDILTQQVAQNIRRGLPQAMPYHPNGQTAVLVAGGPSLKTTEKELVEAYWKGGKIVAVNGAYQWCIDRNLKPSAFVMLDAREFNTRFLETPVEGCHYLLASQCHPSAFEMCRDRKVTTWHAMSAGEDEPTAPTQSEEVIAVQMKPKRKRVELDDVQAVFDEMEADDEAALIAIMNIALDDDRLSV